MRMHPVAKMLCQKSASPVQAVFLKLKVHAKALRVLVSISVMIQ